jgi:uncharacterized protein YjiK
MALSLRLESSQKIAVNELSGVAVTPDGRVFVVDDECGLAEVGRRGRVHFHDDCSINGLEGVAVSSDGRFLFLVSENRRRVHRIPLARDGSLGAPVVIGKLPKGRSKNKGWEGIAWLPKARNAERRDRLVLVHEDRPRVVGLFNPEDLYDHALLELPPELKAALADLSDVAVEPSNGDLYLLSDDSSAIGIARLVRYRRTLALESVAVLSLPVQDMQSEGIAFDGKGRLYLVSERDRRLCVMTLRGKADTPPR